MNSTTSSSPGISLTSQPSWATRVLATSSGASAPILRLGLALVLFPHGAQKLLGWYGGYGWSGTMGFLTGKIGLPTPVAALVILIESIGPLFLLHVAIAGLSLGGMVWLISDLAPAAATLEPAPGFPSRSWAALALAMAGLLELMWAGRIFQALGSTAGTDSMLAGGTTLTVQAIDLVLVLPTLVISAIAALRRTVAGELAAAVVVVVFVAMAAAIDAMLLSAGLINGEFEWPPIAIFGAAALAGLIIGWRMYAILGSSQSEHVPAQQPSVAGAAPARA